MLPLLSDVCKQQLHAWFLVSDNVARACLLWPTVFPPTGQVHVTAARAHTYTHTATPPQHKQHTHRNKQAWLLSFHDSSPGQAHRPVPCCTMVPHVPRPASLLPCTHRATPSLQRLLRFEGARPHAITTKARVPPLAKSGDRHGFGDGHAHVPMGLSAHACWPSTRHHGFYVVIREWPCMPYNEHRPAYGHQGHMDIIWPAYGHHGFHVLIKNVMSCIQAKHMDIKGIVQRPWMSFHACWPNIWASWMQHIDQ
eukprot:1152091-Pelagomonas_calceolata.AAC.4